MKALTKAEILLKELPEPSMPAPEPRRFDVQLPFPPRKIYPVHIAGINENPKSKFYETQWSIDLIAVPMESVRLMYRFDRKETPQARKNLQVWVNNLGEALYNPLWWRIHLDGKPRPPRRGGRSPHRQHPFLDRVHGTHRIRALEALDFNFVYVYFQTGALYQVPQTERWQWQRNERRPTLTTRGGPCPNCGKGVRWSGGRDLTKATVCECKSCGQKGTRDPVYPEPV